MGVGYSWISEEGLGIDQGPTLKTDSLGGIMKTAYSHRGCTAWPGSRTERKYSDRLVTEIEIAENPQHETLT
jgi:hypothetical protein